MTTLKWIVSLPYLVSISFALHICKWVHEHHRLNELNSTYILQHSFSQHHTHLTLLRFSSACPSYLIKSKKDRALWGSFRYWFAYLFFLCFIQFFFHQSVYNGPTDSLAKACWCTRLSLGSSSNQAPFDEKYLLTKKRVLQHIHTFKVKLQIRNKKKEVKWRTSSRLSAYFNSLCVYKVSYLWP